MSWEKACDLSEWVDGHLDDLMMTLGKGGLVVEGIDVKEDELGPFMLVRVSSVIGIVPIESAISLQTPLGEALTRMRLKLES